MVTNGIKRLQALEVAQIVLSPLWPKSTEPQYWLAVKTTNIPGNKMVGDCSKC